MRITVGLLLLLFYLARGLFSRICFGYRTTAQVFSRSREMLADLILREGGRTYQDGRRRLAFAWPDRKMQVVLERHSRVRLTIRQEGSFPHAVSFIRLPRLIFAFLEAFLSPEQRLETLPYFPFAATRDSIAKLKARPGFGALFQRMNRFRFSVRFHPNGVTLFKWIDREDLNEAAFQEMLSLAEDVVRVCGEVELPIPVQPLESERKCAYCKESIEAEELVTHCSLCGTPHHNDCFEINGKCSVFGCDSRRTVETPLTVIS